MTSEIPSLLIYSEDKKDDVQTTLNKELSELDNLFWESCKQSFKKNKPLIVSYPSRETPFIPILAYSINKLINRDVLIVSEKTLLEEYFKRYEHLADKTGDYLFRRSVPLIVDEERTILKLSIKRMPKKQRQIEEDWLFEELKSPDTIKILFSENLDFSRALEEKQTIKDRESVKDVTINLNIGAVILDNLDLSNKNEEFISSIKKWIDDLILRGIFVLIKTENPYSKKLNQVVEKIGGLKLSINYELMEQYNGEYSPRIENYSFLRKNKDPSDIEIIHLETGGNLNEKRMELDNSIGLIKGSKIPLPDSIYQLFNLKEKLLTLFVHPEDFTFPYLDRDGNYQTLNTGRFLELVRKEIGDYKYPNKDELKLFLSLFSSFYKELVQTKRFEQELSYETINKNYLLIEQIKGKIYEVDKINIILYSKRAERKKLFEQINRVFGKLSEKITILSYGELANYKVLPGISFFPGIPYNKKDLIRIKYLCQQPFFILYENLEYMGLEKNKDWKDEQTGLSESIKDLRIIFGEEGERLDRLPITKNLIENKLTKQEFIETPLEPIISLTNLNYSEIDNPLNFEEFIHRINETRGYTNNNQENTLILKVESIADSLVSEIKCRESSQLMVVKEFNNHKDYLLKYSEELIKGDLIIRFGERGNKDILSLISEIYETEGRFDLDKLRFWKDRLSLWILNKRKAVKIFEKDSSYPNIEKIPSTYSDLYRQYKDQCKILNISPRTYVAFWGWINNDKRIGPEEPLDVLAMGKLIGINNIEKEYLEIYEEMNTIRKIHIVIGRKINKILNYILSKNSTNTLDYAEQILCDQIRIYRFIGSVCQ
jgi:hypothetical protein